MNKATDAEIGAAVRLFKTGMGIRAIGKIVGLHRATVSEIVGGMRDRVKFRAMAWDIHTWLEEHGLEPIDCAPLMELTLARYR